MSDKGQKLGQLYSWWCSNRHSGQTQAREFKQERTITVAELKRQVEKSGTGRHYFDKESMRFFGDTMSNYGVRSAIVDGVSCWELYRKRPVKNGNQSSTYFTKDHYKIIYPKHTIETI